MSDRGSERGSEASSDHTDWAFVEDGASQGADNASPERSLSPGRPSEAVEGFAGCARLILSAFSLCVCLADLGASVGAPEQGASDAAQNQ